MNYEQKNYFPDLMVGKKIMYIHGFGSSAQTATVARLRQTFPNGEVVAFDVPVEPHEAIEFLRAKVLEENPDLVIGTSMGGMYAEQLAGFDRILVNPAFQIADTMQEHGLTGKQTFFNPRQDGVQEFYVDKPLVKRYREVSELCFRSAAEDKGRVWGLFGDKDELVHTRELFLQHYPQALSRQPHNYRRSGGVAAPFCPLRLLERYCNAVNSIRQQGGYSGLRNGRAANR